ncbi:MAG: DUF2703 domain-containing protein [Pseudomonadota bacterium]
MTCCSPSADQRPARRVDAIRLEFLFLDETLCKPCRGTDEALDEAIRIVAAPLDALGLRLEVARILIATEEEAVTNRLLSSPTIRIDGVDIDPTVTEGPCESCGDLAGGQTTVTCRRWYWKGAAYAAAPTGKIVEAILAAATSPGAQAPGCCETAPLEAAYALPQNLQGFFAARRAGAPVCC